MPPKPMESQRNIGSDMTMFFFVQPHAPSIVRSPVDQRIKGLNAETIGKVLLPPPPWLLDERYAPLQSAENQDPGPTGIFFSLNLSIYGQQINPSDWSDSWFWMHGRAHPYALTWQIEQVDGLESEVGALMDYTIPAIQIRDLGYQPCVAYLLSLKMPLTIISIAPRSLLGLDTFPTIPPTVSITGPILGSGQSLLNKDAIPGFDEAQLRCCAFVQLSTYISPGSPDKPPFVGYHPFQVFLIFPIFKQPWMTLCNRMMRRAESSFIANAPFSCTGKIAGLLDHRLMKTPPAREEDYIFIIVPDTWCFPERGAATGAAGVATPAKTRPDPSTTSDVMAMFMSPSKRPKTPNASDKRPFLGLTSPDTPSKRSRMKAPAASPSTGKSSSLTSNDSSDELDQIQDENENDKTAGQPSITASSGRTESGDSSNRILRRHPTRKMDTGS
jgi:hypothetical protein